MVPFEGDKHIPPQAEALITEKDRFYLFEENLCSTHS